MYIKEKFYFDANMLKEKLIVSLASNPRVLEESPETNAENIIHQADEIILKLNQENEKINQALQDTIKNKV